MGGSTLSGGGEDAGAEAGETEQADDGNSGKPGSASEPGSDSDSDSGRPGDESGSEGSGGSSSSGGNGCAPRSECTVDDDCEGVSQCVDCACTAIDGDPAYPDPSDGGCPEPTYDTSSYGYPLCSPPCEDGVCPDASSGTAVPTCRIVTDPGSQDPCENFEGPCDTAGEICQFFGTSLACAPPPTHCTLNCAGGDCPDSMTCADGETGEGICVYD